MNRVLSRALTLSLILASVFGVARAQDAARGEQKVAMCMGCHNTVGYQGTFPQVYKVPMIAGQDPKYIVSALTEYRSGDRKHPTMHAIATPLTDQDMADVAAYYAQLGKSVPDERPVPATLETPIPEALKAKLTACTACHGANFSTPTDGTIPRLAGQHADYLYAALKAYRTQNNPRVGRGNATMVGMAAMLDDAEMKEAAEYLSSLPSELKVVPESRFRHH
jgi:cytochrome c553